MNGLASLLNSSWARRAAGGGDANVPGAVARAAAGSGGQAPNATDPAAGSSSSFLSSSNFFQLLTAQLQHQDPLSPMDSTKFMSELAQLSTANGMQSLGQTVASLQSSQSADTRLRATGLIGHYVGLAGHKLTLSGSGGASGAFSLAGAASRVEVTVTNKAGAVVDRFQLGAEGGGAHRFTWDGSGQPPGDYQFSVKAQDASGRAVSAKTLTLAKISSVAFSSSGGITLSFANRSGTLPFGQVGIIF